jgi:hypothetical protein
MDYIAIAQEYIAESGTNGKVLPSATSAYEVQLYYGTDTSEEVKSVWQESCRLYDKFVNDLMGTLTARRRLALVLTRSRELGFAVA